MRSARPAWLAVVCSAALLAGAPASAQGLLEFLFGGARPAAPAPGSISPIPRFTVRPKPRMAGVSYCVRLCDGRYFPIQRSAKATPIELCNAFCPAAATKVFSGSPIEQATARDGSRYDDLDNAYAYRKTVVPDCSCNGREPFGTALMDLASDPTLRAGDLISTVNGLIAYAPNKSDPDAMADVTGSLGLRGKFGSDDAKRSRGATYRLLP